MAGSIAAGEQPLGSFAGSIFTPGDHSLRVSWINSLYIPPDQHVNYEITVAPGVWANYAVTTATNIYAAQTPPNFIQFAGFPFVVGSRAL